MKSKTEPTSAPSCSSKESKLDEKRTAATHKNEKIDKSDASSVVAASATNKKETDQPNFIPFAVRKRADTVATGSRKQTVQALKKKYQDQRIAKNKAQCKTRSSTAKETDTCKMPKSKQNDSDAKTSVNNGAGKGQNKRKLRGAIGANQTDDDEVAIAGKSPKIAKESSKEAKKEASKDIQKDSVEKTTQKTPIDTNKVSKTKL